MRLTQETFGPFLREHALHSHQYEGCRLPIKGNTTEQPLLLRKTANLAMGDRVELHILENTDVTRQQISTVVHFEVMGYDDYAVALVNVED